MNCSILDVRGLQGVFVRCPQLVWCNMMSNFVQGSRGIFGILGCVFLMSCGSATVTTQSSSSSSSGSTGFTSAAVGGSVNSLSVAGDATASFDLSDLGEEESAVLLLFNYNTSSTSEAFEIAPASENALHLVTEPASLLLEDDNHDDGDLTGQFHEKLRLDEMDLDEEALLPESSTRNLSRFSTLGSTRTFKVLNSFSDTSSYDTVDAVLRVSNDEIEFYVDTRDADSLTDAELDTLLVEFAGIADDEKEILGEPSDVNGDGKFAVLFTRVVNELGGSAGGVVTGFFYAIDLFDESTYEASNEMEMYYTFVPDPLGEHGVAVTKEFAVSNIYPGVLPHEFQHMISFNQHYFEMGGSAEAGWLNEGLSHLMEDLHSQDTSGYMTASGLENPARVASYLSDVGSICFTCGTSLSQRGGSYLFLRYLYEQAEAGAIPNVASGVDLIRDLVQTNNRSLSNLKNVLFGSIDADADLKEMMGQFSLAVYLSDTGLSEDPHYNFNGINLRSIQDDNRGTVLNGPALTSVGSFPHVDTLAGNSMVFIEIDADDAESLGGSISLSFGADSDFGGYVIRE